MNKITLFIKLKLTVSLLILAVSCTDYLEIKPDKAQSVPKSLLDFQRLLNSEKTMSFSFGAAGETGSDNIFVGEVNWNRLGSSTQRNLYIWEEDVFNDVNTNDWANPYVVVFNTNIILEGIENIKPSSSEIIEWKEIKGSALFFRSFAFYDLLTHFGQVYKKESADQDLGIVLRLSPDLNKKSVRSSVRDCYQQIIMDLNTSLELLPQQSKTYYTPSKLAVYGLLSRVYLSMEDYEKALEFADQFLKIKSSLLDFNTLDLKLPYPIPKENSEIAFFSTISPYYTLHKDNARISPELYEMFSNNDLRKTVYGRKETNGQYYYFIGNYDGSEMLFNGFAVDELLLVRAECKARLNRPSEALEDLNYLLRNRHKEGTYLNFESSDSKVVLLKILEERRKELMFRGLRWADLRRLNKDSTTAVSIKRILGDREYILEPNSPKYTLPIPLNVIQSSGIQQNRR